MMKLLSGEWLAAERENKSTRDAKRAEFWIDMGVTPAKDASEVALEPARRASIMSSLVAKTLEGRENDPELERITTLAAADVAQLALGSLGTGVARSPSFTKLTPKRLRNYFVTWERTSFEWSEIDPD